MASFAFHPPVHLRRDPDTAIKSVDEALAVVRAHMLAHPDANVGDLLHRLDRADTPAHAERAGEAFRHWAERENLLLMPPDDA
jgi:hypothetical protein